MEKDLSTPLIDAAREAHRQFQAQLDALPRLTPDEEAAIWLNLTGYDHRDPGKCKLCGRQMLPFIGQTEEQWSLAIVCGCDHCYGCVQARETGESDPRPPMDD